MHDSHTPYGRLTVICGPMFAGKSTELLKRILWARNGENRQILVMKPAFDTRYADTEIVSHDGLRADSIHVEDWPADISPEISQIYLDEVQFLEAPRYNGDIVARVQAALRQGIDVFAGGLDADWQGNPFPVTARLLAMADHTIKLPANCTICGMPASKTFRKTKAEGSVALGGGETYESRCNQHWHGHW